MARWKTPPMGARRFAFADELLGLAAHGHIKLRHLHRHALALQHLDGLYLLARPRPSAPAHSISATPHAQHSLSCACWPGQIRLECFHELPEELLAWKTLRVPSMQSSGCLVSG